MLGWVKANRAYFSYRLLSRFAEVLPLRAVNPVANLAGGLAMRFSKSKSEVIRKNLSRAFGRAATDEEVRLSYSSYARYWLELMRLPVIPADMLSESVRVDGFEHIESALAKGNRLILALPHCGNWDAGGAWFVQNSVPMTVVVERLEPEKLFVWFRDFRNSLGLNILTNGPGVGASLTSALNRNEAIGLLSDRDIDGKGVEVQLFGETTTLPKGPAMLAIRTGAALLPVAVHNESDGVRVTVLPPIEVERSSDLRSDVARITQEVAYRMEDLIRISPVDWHVFQPNWPADR